MARKKFLYDRLDLKASELFVEFDVSDATKVSFSARYDAEGGSSWSTAVVTFEKSNDGRVWSSTSTTLSAEGTTSDIDVSTAFRVRARVSTAQSTAGVAYITAAGLLSDEI